MSQPALTAKSCCHQIVLLQATVGGGSKNEVSDVFNVVQVCKIMSILLDKVFLLNLFTIHICEAHGMVIVLPCMHQEQIICPE